MTKLRKAARGKPCMVLTQEFFHARLSYDRNTGSLAWLAGQGSRAVEGKQVGTINTIGYRSFRIGKKDFLAHRVAWFIEYGDWPRLIDHIDGNRSNNAIANLRVATKSTNGANRGKQANNSSGYKGVVKHHRKWVAQLFFQGKNIYLGLHNTPELAHSAYMEKAKELFGEFHHA